MKNTLKIIGLNINKISLIILYFTFVNNVAFAQRNTYLERLKFDNFRNRNFTFIKQWNIKLIAENNIKEIQEYSINSNYVFVVSDGKFPLNDSERDTTYIETYVFDKETSNLVKKITKSDSTLYNFNNNSVKYFSSFPSKEVHFDNSKYVKYIFNDDSLFIKEERYETINELESYIEYNYYNDFIEELYWSGSSESQLPLSRTFIYFTPNRGVLTTSIIDYMGQRLMSNVSLDLYNESGLIIESIDYSDFSQFRTTYHYDERGLPILKKHFIDETLTRESLYKYITQ